MKLKPYSKKSPLTVTVRRKDWIRGGYGDSRLLRLADQKMCCLGFAARKIGFERNQILERLEPNDLGVNICGLARNGNNTSTANELMCANDDTLMSDKAREEKIKSLGKRIGLDFRFVG